MLEKASPLASTTQPTKEENVVCDVEYKIEDMKKTHANTSIYGIAKLAGQRELIIRTLASMPPMNKQVISSNTSSRKYKMTPNIELVINSTTVNLKSSCPPFLLTL